MLDETPNPLLVVRCGINLDRANDPWVAPDDPDPTLPALAVPDALWTDEAFAHRAAQRLAQSYGHVAPSMMLTLLDAIAAELRERANIHQETTP